MARSRLAPKVTLPKGDAPTRLMKRDAVAATLRNEIMRGVLRAGTHLRQFEIAMRLGVSPTPVREALSQLALEGYVEWNAYRGVTVSARREDPIGLADVYRIRADLEVLAVRRGAPSIRPDAIRVLEDAEREARAAELAEDAERWQLANSEFHAGLVAIAGSPLLDRIMASVLRQSLFFARALTPRIHRDHREIIRLLKSGRADDAVRAVASHARANVDDARQREPAVEAVLRGRPAAKGRR